MGSARYSAEELSWLRDNHLLTVAVLCERFREKFGRTVGYHGLMQKRRSLGLGIRVDGKISRKIVGNTSAYRKGNTTNHKQKEGDVIRGGLWWRKVWPTGSKKHKFVVLHRLKWEQQNGPIQSGFVLRCKGDTLNPEPSNWTLTSTAIAPRLNGAHGSLKYSDSPDELKSTILAVAKLDYAARHARRTASE